MGTSVATTAKLIPRLPPLPTIRDIVKIYKLQAMKRLSQNFLLDEKIINKIVNAAGKTINGSYVCEVGPGPGGITRSILSKGCQKVYVIEKDRRFQSTMKMLEDACPGKIVCHWGDVLSFNMTNMFPKDIARKWTDVSPPIHIIGNLPFNISTPLIIRWLRDMSNHTNAWSYGRIPLTLTFQKEVAERLAADASNFQRCRLSIMSQYLCYTMHKLVIPGGAFLPKPDVDVGVVKFIPRKYPLINQPFDLVEKVVRLTFSMRQKYCRRGASTLFPVMVRDEFTSQLFQFAEVNPQTRPFNLTIEEFSRLCDSYAEICRKYPDIYQYNYRGYKPDLEWETLHGCTSRYNMFRKEPLEFSSRESVPTPTSVPVPAKHSSLVTSIDDENV